MQSGDGEADDPETLLVVPGDAPLPQVHAHGRLRLTHRKVKDIRLFVVVSGDRLGLVEDLQRFHITRLRAEGSLVK